MVKLFHFATQDEDIDEGHRERKSRPAKDVGRDPVTKKHVAAKKAPTKEKVRKPPPAGGAARRPAAKAADAAPTQSAAAKSASEREEVEEGEEERGEEEEVEEAVDVASADKVSGRLHVGFGLHNQFVRSV